MAQLFRGARVHQIFGADTDVGKTIFATAVALASAACPLDGSAPERTLRAHAAGEAVAYLKPVSTGSASEADENHLRTFAPHVKAHTLLQFREPVSPHVAAVQDGELPSDAHDEALVSRIGAWIHAHARGAVIIETAGGVHSPAPSGASQADLLRPLRLPTLLIGSSRLGGISTTRAAYESLTLRGYDVDGILLFPSPVYGNDTYLRAYFEARGVRVFTIGGPSPTSAWGPPPVRAATTQQDVAAMRKYYLGMLHSEQGDSALDVVRHLRNKHAERLSTLLSLGARAHAHCWWPFTQHARVSVDDVLTIDSAHGDFFSVFTPTSRNSLLTPMLDGSASWWTQAVGHAHPRLSLAAAYAAGRYGHVLFPGAAHEPAVRLAERLLATTGHGWAARVFYSDDGSTGMEVALKMALQASVRRYAGDTPDAATQARIAPGRQPGSLGGRPPRVWEVLGLQGSYHGDTIGAMDACEPSVFSAQVEWYQGRGYWMAPPTVHLRAGRVHIEVADVDRDWPTSGVLAHLDAMDDVYQVEARLATPLAEHYRRVVHAALERLVLQERRRFGALILEPLVMGAGGMRFVDPLFQRCLVDVVRDRTDLFALSDPPLRDARAGHAPPGAWRGLPVVYDEVFAGLGRLGFVSGTEALGVAPDVACVAKILSGGTVPLAATLASDSLFRSFTSSTDKAQALLHGHSYTAHPVGCQIALETLAMLESIQLGRGHSVWDRASVARLSHLPRVDSVMALGTVLAVALRTGHAGYASDEAESVVRRLVTQAVPPACHPSMPPEASGHHGSPAFPLHLRPLGNIVYVMASLTTPEVVRQRTLAALEQVLQTM
ncbi:hypothetical protein MNAN1_003454 [Malassezia nana]|uniref:Dethiobiotin synthase n=1 Tax=Malassezia nana TaxID=180528 RepID=A0AAF0EPT6_9BASI|nr:hypothetical protein MNAN1_003454 [Malassezia nana]